MVREQRRGPGIGCVMAVLLAIFAAFPPLRAGAEGLVKSEVDWPAFMSRHDMVFRRLPESWKEALWFGNGHLGSMIWREGDRIRIQVFRSDVQDFRSYRTGYSGYSQPRLQIGSFYIKPKGRITGGQGRLDLYDAEFNGTIETDRGRLHIRHLVQSSAPVIFTEITADGGESDPAWEWEPAAAAPTRTGAARTDAELEAMRRAYSTDYFAEVYEPNPAPELLSLGGVEVSRQMLLAGAEHSVAWQVLPSTAASPQRCLISIASCSPGTPQDSDREAAAAVRNAAGLSADGLRDWIDSHRSWWNGFYARSFVSLTDTRVETVYWTQMYKLGSAVRADSPIVDHGLWQTPSPWTFLTWDLNIQLSYWPTTTSNHIELGMSLVNWMWAHRSGLIANVPVEAWRADSARAPLNTGWNSISPRRPTCGYWTMRRQT